jgi:hypothetical protein
LFHYALSIFTGYLRPASRRIGALCRFPQQPDSFDYAATYIRGVSSKEPDELRAHAAADHAGRPRQAIGVSLQYYVYISDAKVDLLLPQISGARKGKVATEISVNLISAMPAARRRTNRRDPDFALDQIGNPAYRALDQQLPLHVKAGLLCRFD